MPSSNDTVLQLYQIGFSSGISIVTAPPIVPQGGGAGGAVGCAAGDGLQSVHHGERVHGVRPLQHPGAGHCMSLDGQTSQWLFHLDISCVVKNALCSVQLV